MINHEIIQFNVRAFDGLDYSAINSFRVCDLGSYPYHFIN